MAKLQNVLIGSALVLTPLFGNASYAQSTPARSKPPAAVPIDLCSFLTQKEAEEILGRKLQTPEKHGSACWYGTNPGAPDVILSFIAVRPKSRGEFDAFIEKEVSKLNKRMKDLGAKKFVIEPVKELSDPAYYVDPSLLIYRNNRVLGIVADRPQAIAIAGKAIPRWK
jgi:hypothetical protein